MEIEYNIEYGIDIDIDQTWIRWPIVKLSSVAYFSGLNISPLLPAMFFEDAVIGVCE